MTVAPVLPVPSVVASVQSPVWRMIGSAVGGSRSTTDALAQASLDWEVAELPIELSMPFTDNRLIRTHKAIVRADTHDLLGVVGSKYRPIQNHRAFGFLDDLVGEFKLTLETAGELHGGKVVWMLVRLPQRLRVKGTDDVSDQYLLCVNSHDGTKAFRVLTTMVRVVCQNTLTLALREGSGSGLSLRHLPNVLERVDDARRALKLACGRFEQTEAEIHELSARRISENRTIRYFASVWPDDEASDDTTRAEATRRQLLENFYAEGERIRPIAGTVWAAVNAVTHYADFQRPSRGANEHRKQNNRLESIWFGDSAALKRRAWELALQIARN